LSAALLLVGGVALATALALLAPLGWPFELFSHFRVQCAAAALVLAVFLGWRRRPVAAGLAIVLAAWNMLPVAQRALAASPAVSCTGPEFTVVTANLQYSNTHPERFMGWLASHPADLVVLQEVTEAWVETLAARPDYPNRYLLSREDPYGIGVLSRWPLEAVQPTDLSGDGLPSVAGIVEVEGRRIRFLGLHTHWPVLPGFARLRDVTLDQAAGLARNSDVPVVLLGDLNLTPDAPAFARLLRDSGLRDVIDGGRWSPTWRAGFWPLALRIDHILVSPEICVEHAAAGPAVGSDHRPVSARLRLSR
jgi:endonuclease/exonuclease/phosphatase (EEP) superfamily protein YafD